MLFQREEYNMAEETKTSREDLLKAAISHEKKDLSEIVDVTDFLNILYSKDVIGQREKEEIEACLTNKGPTNAADLFWSMLLSDKIPVVRFYDTIKQGKSEASDWLCKILDEFVAKVKSGEWPLHGEPDLKSRFQYILFS